MRRKEPSVSLFRFWNLYPGADVEYSGNLHVIMKDTEVSSAFDVGMDDGGAVQQDGRHVPEDDDEEYRRVRSNPHPHAGYNVLRQNRIEESVERLHSKDFENVKSKLSMSFVQQTQNSSSPSLS